MGVTMIRDLAIVVLESAVLTAALLVGGARLLPSHHRPAPELHCTSGATLWHDGDRAWCQR